MSSPRVARGEAKAYRSLGGQEQLGRYLGWAAGSARCRLCRGRLRG